MSITRIEPKSKLSLFEWREILEFRDLLYFLSLRDIQLRYKQTALGVVWVILQPLVPAVIFSILFGALARLPSNGVPYILLVFSGMLPWNIFNNILGRAGGSLVANANLLSKVFFPRIIIPMASIGSVIVDSLVSIGVLAIFLVVFQVPLTWNILAAPVFIGIAFITGFGVSLIVTSLNVYFRDFGFLIPFALQIWNYASPVVYSSELIPEKWRWLYALNPIVGLIEGFRWSVLGKSPLNVEMLCSTFIFAIVSVICGAVIFKKIERGFVDIV